MGCQSFHPRPPLLEPVGAATENLKEASTSVEPASFIEDIVRGGRSCAEEILTESSEMTAQPEAQIIVGNCYAKDEGERNLELAIDEFSETSSAMRSGRCYCPKLNRGSDETGMMASSSSL